MIENNLRAHFYENDNLKYATNKVYKTTKPNNVVRVIRNTKSTLYDIEIHPWLGKKKNITRIVITNWASVIFDDTLENPYFYWTYWEPSPHLITVVVEPRINSLDFIEKEDEQ